MSSKRNELLSTPKKSNSIYRNSIGKSIINLKTNYKTKNRKSKDLNQEINDTKKRLSFENDDIFQKERYDYLWYKEKEHILTKLNQIYNTNENFIMLGTTDIESSLIGSLVKEEGILFEIFYSVFEMLVSGFNLRNEEMIRMYIVSILYVIYINIIYNILNTMHIYIFFHSI